MVGDSSIFAAEIIKNAIRTVLKAITVLMMRMGMSVIEIGERRY